MRYISGCQSAVQCIDTENTPTHKFCTIINGDPIFALATIAPAMISPARKSKTKSEGCHLDFDSG